MHDDKDTPRPKDSFPVSLPDRTAEPAGHDKRPALVAKIMALDVPKSTQEELSANITSGGELSLPDRNSLAHELATLDEDRFAAVVRSAWTRYQEQYPHLRLLTDRLKYGGYNPLYDRPPVVYVHVNPDLTALASVSPDNRSLTTRFTDSEQRQITVTQLLTGDYSSVYPPGLQDEHNAEKTYRPWAHETGHMDLNPAYKQIIDAIDAHEKQLRPDHLTVADKAGNHASISAFQEAVVELAASEMLGTEVTTLPNNLFADGKVGHLLDDLKRQAGSDEKTWELWYAHPLRPEVSRMCKSIIQARINGVNPLDLGQKVNEVILKNIRDNHMRHTDITFGLIADMVDTVTKTGLVAPTMPPLGIQPEQIDVFTPQRKVLQNLVAQEWLKTSAAH